MQSNMKNSIIETNQLIRTMIVQFAVKEQQSMKQIKKVVEDVYRKQYEMQKDINNDIKKNVKTQMQENMDKLGYDRNKGENEFNEQLKQLVDSIFINDQNIGFIQNNRLYDQINQYQELKINYKPSINTNNYNFQKNQDNVLIVNNNQKQEQQKRKGHISDNSQINTVRDTSYSEENRLVSNVLNNLQQIQEKSEHNSEMVNRNADNKNEEQNKQEQNNEQQSYEIQVIKKESDNKQNEVPADKENDKVEQGTVQSVVDKQDGCQQELFSPMVKMGKQKKLKKVSKFAQVSDNEMYICSFSCALLDGIILQGKLYLTSQKAVFYSPFNKKSLFFSKTIMQIPKADILYIQKRTTAKIFHNAISMYTIRGEIAFSSFYQRDKAYETIILNYKPPQQLDLKEIIEKNQNQNSHDIEKIEKHDDEDIMSEEGNDDKGDVDHEVIVQEEQREVIEEMKKQNLEKLKVKLEDYQKECKMVLESKCQLSDVFRLIFGDNQVYINRQKYGSFLEFLKKEKMKDTQLKIQEWSDLPQNYKENKGGMESIIGKKDAEFIKSMSYVHPTNVMIGPKTCNVDEKYRLLVIDETRFIVEIELHTSGTPSADAFVVYQTYDIFEDKQLEQIQIVIRLCLQFNKSTILKGTITSHTYSNFDKQTNNVVIPAIQEVVSQNIKHPYYRRVFYKEGKKKNKKQEQEENDENVQQMTSSQNEKDGQDGQYIQIKVNKRVLIVSIMMVVLSALVYWMYQ